MSDASITHDSFGHTSTGHPVDRYTLHGPHGMRARIITYGATLTELHVPDRDGQFADVVLGFDRLDQYETQSPYFGCMVGRVAFRIVGGQFELDGKTYHLTKNNGLHHLHGGTRGFSHVVWTAHPHPDPRSPSITFTHRSPAGDQGYPGTLDVSVTYTLTDTGDLRIESSATTDAPTLINLTHHSYFNLAGTGDVLGHVLQLATPYWLPDAAPLIPSGQIASVTGTPFDFTHPTLIGQRIHDLPATRGYDLAYLRDNPAGELLRIATLTRPPSGRRMDVLTTEPALVLYTGNYLDGTLQGKGDIAYPQYGGVCLETGKPPDAIHHANFPSVVLRAGERYGHVCLYRFIVE